MNTFFMIFLIIIFTFIERVVFFFLNFIIRVYLFYLYCVVAMQLSFVNNLLKHHQEKFATTWRQIADWWSATPHQCLYQLLLLFLFLINRAFLFVLQFSFLVFYYSYSISVKQLHFQSFHPWLQQHAMLPYDRLLQG